MRPERPAAQLPVGGEVMLIGLFSGKDKDVDERFDELACLVQAHGGRVVGRIAQRRGVSHGGVAKMSAPLSRRTLLSAGKAREAAGACRSAAVTAAVFVNSLTRHQRHVLGAMFDCAVLSREDLTTHRR